MSSKKEKGARPTTLDKPLNYFACDGGPHLILPTSVRSHWKAMGSNFNPLDASTDYRRACSVEPPIGLISVGDEHALVLAGSPPMSAWEATEDTRTVNLYVFEAWKDTNLDPLAKTALAHISSDRLTDTGIRWVLKSKGVNLMFAGDLPGQTAYGEVPIPLPAGTYRAFKGQYEGNLGKLWVIQLRP